MFIRKVKNRSGNTAIQVAQKIGRRNQIVKHIGTARSLLEVHELTATAQKYIDTLRIKSGVISLFDTRHEPPELNKLLQQLTFTRGLDTLTYRFLYYFYRRLGFSSLQDTCFQDLVIARIARPCSKRKTREVLEVLFGQRYSLTGIYRTLRTSATNRYAEKIAQVVRDFVKQDLGQDIAIVFFDVTTLYFEAFDEDETRKCGFSKDHKHNQPQIVVALMVTTQGIPLAMRMFEGNKFEGHTLLPCIDDLVRTYSLTDMVVIADAAMLNENNLAHLEEKQLKYIVGARLGNINDALFEQITSTLPKTDGASMRINLAGNRILLVSHSENRAKKDRHDREHQIQKAQGLLKTPSAVMKRYKFIAASQNGTYRLNQKLIEKAEQMEGLKGYVTNATQLSNEEIKQKYSELWQVEKSFRMSKSDLKARPIFHNRKQSIEAHLLIVFAAMVISRYIELISQKSITKVVGILSQVKEIIVEDNVSKQRTSKYTKLTEEAKQLAKLANIDWVT